MRIYKDFYEARSEIRRDLKEMGREISTRSYQNKMFGDNDEGKTCELVNYCYSVSHPAITDLYDMSSAGGINVKSDWIEAEWQDRLSGINDSSVNPGKSWLLNKKVWEQFLVNDSATKTRKFDYTYSERLSLYDQVTKAGIALNRDPNTRQAVVHIFTPGDMRFTGGVKRIPCSLNYQFRIIDKKLCVTYSMRSCDFYTHFWHDVALAINLNYHVLRQLRKVRDPVCEEPGSFTHFIHSLHIFEKHVAEVF